MQWLLASLIREMMRKAHPNFTGKNAETTAGNGSGIPLRDPLQRSPSTASQLQLTKREGVERICAGVAAGAHR